MFSSNDILRLYSNVLHNDIIIYKINHNDIRTGVQNMAKTYAPEGGNFESNDRDFPNFNNAAFRCAYLHKYAPFHTYIVLDAMLVILNEKKSLFLELINSGKFNFCCLGGGPGSDVIGILAAFHAAFNSFKSSATIIDIMQEWESTFSSLLRELRFGQYGNNWNNLYLGENFQWSYIGANLLLNMTNEVNKAIGSASFITMVKFVSAASCTTAEPMIEKIFRVMKPGCLLLFIDNAAGGFTQVVERASKKNSFKVVISPRRHVLYENENFKTERFGYPSCFKTTVTILLLQKPLHRNKRIAPRRQVAEGGIDNLLFEEDNLNHILNKTNSNFHKFPIKNDNLNINLRKTGSNSHKLPIKNDNLNHNTRKSDFSPQKLPIKNDNLNYNFRNPVSSPQRLPVEQGKLSSNSRKSDFSSANNQNIYRGSANKYRSYPSYVIRSDVQSISNNSGLDSQNDDDHDDVNDDCCSCCVIS